MAIGLTAAQWTLINLIASAAMKGLTIGLKALENLKKVRNMTEVEVDRSIAIEEARSKELEKQLDES